MLPDHRSEDDLSTKRSGSGSEVEGMAGGSGSDGSNAAAPLVQGAGTGAGAAAGTVSPSGRSIGGRSRSQVSTDSKALVPAAASPASSVVSPGDSTCTHTNPKECVCGVGGGGWVGVWVGVWCGTCGV
jgi:hypothetical protein